MNKEKELKLGYLRIRLFCFDLLWFGFVVLVQKKSGKALIVISLASTASFLYIGG